MAAPATALTRVATRRRKIYLLWVNSCIAVLISLMSLMSLVRFSSIGVPPDCLLKQRYCFLSDLLFRAGVASPAVAHCEPLVDFYVVLFAIVASLLVSRSRNAVRVF